MHLQLIYYIITRGYKCKEGDQSFKLPLIPPVMVLKWPSLHNEITTMVASVYVQYVISGAHEPPKEHATYAAYRVPSQSKFIVINRQLLLNSFHIWKVFWPHY